MTNGLMYNTNTDSTLDKLYIWQLHPVKLSTLTRCNTYDASSMILAKLFRSEVIRRQNPMTCIVCNP